MTALERPAGLRVHVELEYDNSVAKARNTLAALALERGAEWIFWLDDDLMFSPDVLVRLLEKPQDIVIGLSLMRGPWTEVSGYNFWPLWSTTEIRADGHWTAVQQIVRESNGLMRLLSGTGGGVLTHRRVFERMTAPYWQIGQVVKDQFWEDIWFYQEARKAGFEVWGNPDVHFGHQTSHVVWPHENADGQWSSVVANGWHPLLNIQWPAPTRELVGV